MIEKTVNIQMQIYGPREDGFYVVDSGNLPGPVTARTALKAIAFALEEMSKHMKEEARVQDARNQTEGRISP